MPDNKFDSILNEIKSNREVLKVFVPSLQREVDLQPLTLAQQKLIIETTTDTTLGVLFFNNIFYKILKANVGTDISKLTTVDRVNLTLALRKHLNDEIRFDDDTVVKISGILERNSNIQLEIGSEEIRSGDFIFEVEPPTLGVDNFINTHLLNRYKSASLDDNKLKNLISDLYTHEILKFIKTLRINDQEITLHTELVKSIKVVESIDTNHFTQVTEFINTVRDVEASYTKSLSGEKSIDITPDLFIF